MDCSSLPLIGEADIVVCGGGTAGAFAAIAAADSGCRVLVAEQTGSLGGAAVNGLVVPMMNTGIPGNPQCSYISRRLHNELLESGGADASGMNFDPILLEATLERLCTDSGVRICFYTTFADAVTEGNKISEIVVVNKTDSGASGGKSSSTRPATVIFQSGPVRSTRKATRRPGKTRRCRSAISSPASTRKNSASSSAKPS